MMPQRAANLPSGEAVWRILVRCSRTGRLFPTGLTSKGNSFALINVADNKLTCCFCGEVHVWTQENVVFGRVPGKSESGKVRG